MLTSRGYDGALGTSQAEPKVFFRDIQDAPACRTCTPLTAPTPPADCKATGVSLLTWLGPSWLSSLTCCSAPLVRKGKQDNH